MKRTIIIFALYSLLLAATAHAAQQRYPLAVRVARAHVDAWSHHDFTTARSMLAPNVHVLVTSTQLRYPNTNLTGINDYMLGLREFARSVVSGSARIAQSIGNTHDALLVVIAKAHFASGGPQTVVAARMYRVSDAGKIEEEHVVFYVEP